MEAALRWSPHSTSEQQHFILLDVNAHYVKLCEVESYDGEVIRYNQLSQNTKAQAFRAFDWSPTNEALVAVGLSSGEATVLRIDDNSNETYSFQIKSQRPCNSVAFSTKGLLATGLDRVRNDYSLNIWDVDQRLSIANTQGNSSTPSKILVEPLKKLSSSEGVTSIKFFADQPDTLVAGMRGQSLRLYDIREASGNAALQFLTRCVHNLGIDSNDENYFASAGPQGDPTVCIWDRRLGPRSSATTLSSGNNANDGSHFVASLELNNVIDSSSPSTRSSVWSIRYSKKERGCLGVLSNTGELKIIDTAKEYDTRTSKNGQTGHNNTPVETQTPEAIRTKVTRNIQYPFYNRSRGRKESLRAVSFDFITTRNVHDGHRIITLQADGQIKVLNIPSIPGDFGYAPTGCAAIGRINSLPDDAKNALSQLSGSAKVMAKDFTEIQPTQPGKDTIAKTLDKFRAKINAARVECDKNTLAINNSNETKLKANPKENVLSSHEAHMKLLDSLGPPGFRLSVGDFLAMSPDVVMSRRCWEGYLFDCSKNLKIVSDDLWLQDMWSWIERADWASEDSSLQFGTVDLSYLGVHAIWNRSLGPNADGRKIAEHLKFEDFPIAISEINHRFQRVPYDGVSTDYPEHRQYCLALCGWAFPMSQLKTIAQELVKQGKHTKAAAWAVFHNQPKLAMTALSKGNESHKLLALGIAGFNNIGGATNEGNDEEWAELCNDIAHSLHDPYSKAILTLVSKGDWSSVIEQTSLPLRDRVGVALRFLDDNELTTFLNDLTAESIRQGDIEGIYLTGLTEEGMDLFQTYITKTGDVQTAVLAMSFTNPLFVKDYRFEFWRESYRSSIDTWKMHTRRARFDVLSTRKSVTYDGRVLIQPPPRQVTLACNYCSQSVAYASRDDESTTSNAATVGEASTTVTNGNPLGGPGATSGTVCPKCKRHLPRCAVCMHWLGMPDPSTPGGAAAVEGEDRMARFINFCMACNHGFHAHHARDWFAKNKNCPVPECGCVCAKHE
ncbi:MAG: hypothetical protein M1827_006820 [Pycnora praestabilis]|nr:MAG: hypothetical protein M1827_006820 [Pycnora praestabilis]